jgi:hypothetical protein
MKAARIALPFAETDVAADQLSIDFGFVRSVWSSIARRWGRNVERELIGEALASASGARARFRPFAVRVDVQQPAATSWIFSAARRYLSH